MGNNSSSAGYSRLPPPPSDSTTQPLLANYINNTKRVSKREEHYIQANQIMKTWQENAIQSLNTNFSRQERSLMPGKVRNSNLNFEPQVNALERRLAMLEPLLYEVKKQEEQIKKIKEKNFALEKKVLELLAIIDESKNKESVGNAVRNKSDNIRSPSIPNLIDMDYQVYATCSTNPSKNFRTTQQSSKVEVIKNPFDRKLQHSLDSEDNYSLLNNLIGCIMVVIFLITFIIGLLI